MTPWRNINESILRTLRNKSYSVANLHFVETMAREFRHAFQSVSLSCSIQTWPLVPLPVNKLSAICDCISPQPADSKHYTISPSKSLLAEAACDLLQHTLMDPIGHLAQHSELDCIDLGRRGELVAAFIVMQARDQAAKQKRWMSTPEFMKALLPSAHYEALKFSMLTSWLEGEHESFSDTFKGYGRWFNHVIRVGSSEMLSADSLWKLLMRGAMIVCKDNHFGIDCQVH